MREIVLQYVQAVNICQVHSPDICVDLKKELIADLLRPFLGTCLDKASKFAFEMWVQSGAWQQEGDGDRTLDAIGCALLKSPPIPLDSFVAMQSKHFWVLWHAWGSPAPRDTFPPLMFFEVADAVRFCEPIDITALCCRAGTARYQSCWTIDVPEASAIQMLSQQCCRGLAPLQRRSLTEFMGGLGHARACA